RGGAVRAGGSLPEAARLAGRAGLQECGEVARVIDPADPRRRHFHFERVVARPGRIAFEAGGPEVARPPAFAGQADRVARLLQQVRVNHELGRKDAVVADGLVELPGV